MKVTHTNINTMSLLTIVFIVLKLTDVITWSWLWVLSPIWISWLAVFLIITLLSGVWIINKLTK